MTPHRQLTVNTTAHGVPGAPPHLASVLDLAHLRHAPSLIYAHGISAAPCRPRIPTRRRLLSDPALFAARQHDRSWNGSLVSSGSFCQDKNPTLNCDAAQERWAGRSINQDPSIICYCAISRR